MGNYMQLMRSSLMMFTIISLLLIVLQANCGSSELDNRNSSAEYYSDETSQVDFEKAKQLALKDAKSRDDLSFEPDRVAQSYIEREYLPDLHYLVVYGPLGHSQQKPYAVSQKGDVYKLPAEFNRMMAAHNVSLESAGDSKRFFQFYLTFEHIWPGMDRIIILDEITDIPGIKDKNTKEQLNDSFFSPEIKESGEIWNLQLYTWAAVNGIVTFWDVSVSVDGQTEINKRHEIMRSVGNYIMVE